MVSRRRKLPVFLRDIEFAQSCELFCTFVRIMLIGRHQAKKTEETSAEMTVVLLEKHSPHVAIVRFNRPDVRNALNTEVRQVLHGHFAALANDPEVRCVVLTGNEQAFAAGADIQEQAGRDVVGAIEAYTTRAIMDFPKPVIAAVNGFALGGGCEFAMQCDIIIANDKAKFGQPEIKLGLIPGAGGTSVFRERSENSMRSICFSPDRSSMPRTRCGWDL